MILRLRGGHTANGRSVQWADDVVDNEGLGRKSSKGAFFLSSLVAICDGAATNSLKGVWQLTNLRLCSVLHIPPAQGG